MGDWGRRFRGAMATAALAIASCATTAETQDPATAPTPPPSAEQLPQAPLNPTMAEVFDGTALRVILCGTSSPLPDPDRAKACTLIVAGDKAYVVDTGPESWEQLARMQLPGVRIAGVFLTHFHSDHIGELGEFRMQTMVAGRRSMLPVYGPQGVTRIVDGFNLAFEEDANSRLAHHGDGLIDLAAAPLLAKPFGADFNGELTEEEVVLRDGDLTVTAFEVDHDPVRPAVGYRFDWKDRSVVISGDLALSDNLVENAQGADVLVSESLANNLIMLGARQAQAQNRPRVAKILADIIDYHATPVEAAEMANAADVELLVFTHYVPSTQAASPAYFAGVNDVRPADTWVAGYDGFRVDLPAGSEEILQSDLLPKP